MSLPDRSAPPLPPPGIVAGMASRAQSQTLAKRRCMLHLNVTGSSHKRWLQRHNHLDGAVAFFLLHIGWGTHGWSGSACSGFTATPSRCILRLSCIWFLQDFGAQCIPIPLSNRRLCHSGMSTWFKLSSVRPSAISVSTLMDMGQRFVQISSTRGRFTTTCH